MLMEILLEVAAFAGKTLLITFALVAILVVIANLATRMKPPKESLEVENLNDRFDDFSSAIREVTASEKQLKAERKARTKLLKKQKVEGLKKSRLFVLDFEGDIRASQVELLRDEITAILAGAQTGDEVFVRLESTGGMVHSYGLAAAQLMRVRERGLPLTVSVDKVAASGGYMMACTANKILAAPFAIIGSIGVIAQVPNLHRVLKKHDIDYEEITAGEFKRTISLLGEITTKGRQKFVEQIEDTHKLFKEFVSQHRPQLNVPEVATGEYWFGRRALALGLVDQLISSDDYLFGRRDNSEILEVHIRRRKSLSERVSGGISGIAERVLWTWWQRMHDEAVFRG